MSLMNFSEILLRVVATILVMLDHGAAKWAKANRTDEFL